MHSSPGVPRGTVSPVTGSRIFTSTCGCTVPTVATRRANGVSVELWQLTGLVSVMPHA